MVEQRRHTSRSFNKKDILNSHKDDECESIGCTICFYCV